MTDPKDKDAPLVKPEWYPWDDDVTNENGWYGRKEMDDYIEKLQAELEELKSELECTEKVYRMNREYVEKAKEQNAKLQSELDSARAEVKELNSEANSCTAVNFKLRLENAQLRSALEFYACVPLNANLVEPTPDSTEHDWRKQPMGTVARAALAGRDEGESE